MCQQWPSHSPKTYLNHTDTFLLTSSHVGLPSAISMATLHPIPKLTICSYTCLFLLCVALAHALRNIFLLGTFFCRNRASRTCKPCNGWPRATQHLNTHGSSQDVRLCRPVASLEEGPQKRPTPPMTASQYSLEKKGAEHLPLYRSLEKKGYKQPPTVFSDVCCDAADQ